LGNILVGISANYTSLGDDREIKGKIDAAEPFLLVYNGGQPVHKPST
jgi:hypothetical protein